MNKIFKLLFFVILVNVIFIKVQAVECDYGDFSITIDETSGYSKVTSGNYNITEELSEYLKKEKKCVYIYKCERYESSLGVSIPYRGLYPDRSTAIAGKYNVDEDCEQLEVGGKKVSKKDGTCISFKKKYDPLVELLGQYNNCNDTSCKYDKKNSIREQLDGLKAVCKQLLASVDYDDPCVDLCTNLEKDESINEVYKILGMNSSKNKNECGLSDRLISFVANLLKWVKFVIPVLVIIFGILDFIKAVGADKDDEMKKAQGKFAKRLIAAALIFIVPFILEFILNKMGFITEGCGILEF